MIKYKPNEQLIKVSNWLALKTDTIEVILALLILISLVPGIASDFMSGILMILTLSSLSVLYFLRAYSVSDDKYAGGMERFTDKIASLALSICIIGILFRLENWPGYHIMLLVGSLILVIIFPVIFVLQSKKPDLKTFSRRMKLRIFVVAAIGLLLYFTPAKELKRSGMVKTTNTEITGCSLMHSNYTQMKIC